MITLTITLQGEDLGSAPRAATSGKFDQQQRT